ncbi:hypothetical protein BDM02DRAFT_3118551 [Thelephora ganbajun]|uniref:Uncharacterized protein n=1 Tax=Thelephora ganbajun TaxID=370292 RepID=A0ACB6ZA98_THEGA|nr:hypothetical protein BDM02DRAFT_3118551 [Thelephora ganbajun]
MASDKTVTNERTRRLNLRACASPVISHLHCGPEQKQIRISAEVLGYTPRESICEDQKNTNPRVTAIQ